MKVASLAFFLILVFSVVSPVRGDIGFGSYIEGVGVFNEGVKPSAQGSLILFYNDYRDESFGGFIRISGIYDDSAKGYGGGYWQSHKIPWLRIGVGAGGIVSRFKEARYFGVGLVQLGNDSTDFYLLATGEVGDKNEYGYSYRIDASLFNPQEYSIRLGFLIERFSGIGPKVVGDLDSKARIEFWAALLWSNAVFGTEGKDPKLLVGLRINLGR